MIGFSFLLHVSSQLIFILEIEKSISPSPSLVPTDFFLFFSVPTVQTYLQVQISHGLEGKCEDLQHSTDRGRAVNPGSTDADHHLSQGFD